MKKLICLFLATLLLLPVFGCQRPHTEFRYTFYYPRADYGYNTQEGKFYNTIVEPELRKDIIDHSPDKILNLYLNGPIDQTLINPFSKELSVKSVSIDGDVLHIVITDHLSELTGIDLMITCACLARTGIELTNSSSVEISCQTALLDGKKSVLFHKDSIIFGDTATATTHKQE